MSTSKSEVVKFYEETRKYYGVYHNHKETSAWAGVVLHFAFCAAMAKAASDSRSTLLCSIVITALLIIECAFIVIYMQWQFALKDEGGALSAAATALELELLAVPESHTALRDYLTVEESGHLAYQARHVLPLKLLKKADVLNSRGRGAQNAVRWAAYILVLVGSVVVIALAWI